MKLIVGLGNIGSTYAKTRHNVGFLCLDKYLSKNYISTKIDNKLKSEIGIVTGKAIFIKPQTYMNLSGEAVRAVFDYYKIKQEDILVIYDDMDLPFAKMRVREKGSAGGHNGIKNIILHLASQDIKRVRIGISGHEDMDAKDYVLGKFNKEQLEIMDKVSDKVSNLIDDFINEVPFQMIMERYNKEN